MFPIDEKLMLLKPILGEEKIRQLRQMYLFEDDFRQKKELENYIDLLIAQKVKPTVDDEIILPPPSETICNGDIYVGQIEYRKKPVAPFFLKLQDINRHVGIFGATGSGKTTFALNMIRQLHKRKIPVLIFDWETNYRHLINELPGIGVFTIGKDVSPFFLNFLTVPPGIDFEEYIKSVIAIISEDYIGGIGADTMLLQYMEMAFQETGHPCFEDLKQIILREITKDKGRGGKLAGRSGLWKESVSRQITFMSKGAAGKVINSRKHFPLEKLLDRPIVLEFGNLKSPYDRKFFIHLILNWLSIYTQNAGRTTDQLTNVMFFEEFHNIAMKSKEDNMVSTLFREIRKYGIGLVALDQTPSEIPNAIFSNMNVKVSFALGTHRDISTMAKAMNMTPGTSNYPGMLKTGQALINVKQRHHATFLLAPPFSQQPAFIGDEELRAKMQQFSAQISLEIPGQPQGQSSQASQKNDNPSSCLEALEKVVFTSIIENPLDGVDKRTKRLGFHPAMMVKIHDDLTQKGLIKPVYVDRIKLFEITDHGRNIAQQNRIPIPQKEGKGGLEHDYWGNQLLQFLRKHEFEPVCEKLGIDIVAFKEKLAIEIETGKSDIKRNLLKLENSQVLSKCFMLATNKQAELKIMKYKKQHPSISFMNVRQFLQLQKQQVLE